ncbi:hypothetical protein N0X72_07400 [Streptomyces carpaticus]|uniref:hypothetical protein n=1 Tax=Streptomyces TaxID=1883 RepID=UPI00220AEC10|nr:hypothetical protein N0X72_07400 [Streptomyces carpaticus]
MSTSPAPTPGGPAAPDTPPPVPGEPASGAPASAEPGGPGLLIIGSGADDAPVCDADGVCAL